MSEVVRNHDIDGVAHDLAAQVHRHAKDPPSEGGHAPGCSNRACGRCPWSPTDDQ